MKLSVKIFYLNINIDYHGNDMDIKLIGNRIRRARRMLNLTQEALAAKLGKSQNLISEWETGGRKVGVEELPDLAHALEVPISYFFGDIDSYDEAVGLFALLNQDERREIIRIMELKIELRKKVRNGA